MKTKIFWGNQYVGSIHKKGIKTRFIEAVKKYLILTVKLEMLCWLMLLPYLYAVYSHPVPLYAVTEITKPLKIEDFPMLIKICKAESGGRQFLANGNVVRGGVNPSDLGFCQINEYINNDEARRLGYDIYTEKGNKDYAIFLFMNRGTQPWNSSKCIKGGWGTASECR